MNIKDSVALVTGANRGLGRAWTQLLLEAGARKVYACARDPATVDATAHGIVPVKLDITRQDQVDLVARQCGDVSLLVNNAGIVRGGGLLDADAWRRMQQELETNLGGTLAVSRAFAPILAAGGGGAIVNVLSVLSWLSLPGGETYAASKAATWSMTNGLRAALRGQGTQVLALHVGFMDTDMTAGVSVPKAAPADVVRQALAALEAGREEVLADDMTREAKRGLSLDPGVYLGQGA